VTAGARRDQAFAWDASVKGQYGYSIQGVVEPGGVEPNGARGKARPGTLIYGRRSIRRAPTWSTTRDYQGPVASLRHSSVAAGGLRQDSYLRHTV
jgi:hypothetical protein